MARSGSALTSSFLRQEHFLETVSVLTVVTNGNHQQDAGGDNPVD